MYCNFNDQITLLRFPSSHVPSSHVSVVYHFPVVCHSFYASSRLVVIRLMLQVGHEHMPPYYSSFVPSSRCFLSPVATFSLTKPFFFFFCNRRHCGYHLIYLYFIPLFYISCFNCMHIFITVM